MKLWAVGIHLSFSMDLEKYKQVIFFVLYTSLL